MTVVPDGNRPGSTPEVILRFVRNFAVTLCILLVVGTIPSVSRFIDTTLTRFWATAVGNTGAVLGLEIQALDDMLLTIYHPFRVSEKCTGVHAVAVMLPFIAALPVGVAPKLRAGAACVGLILVINYVRLLTIALAGTIGHGPAVTVDYVVWPVLYTGLAVFFYSGWARRALADRATPSVAELSEDTNGTGPVDGERGGQQSPRGTDA